MKTIAMAAALTLAASGAAVADHKAKTYGQHAHQQTGGVIYVAFSDSFDPVDENIISIPLSATGNNGSQTVVVTAAALQAALTPSTTELEVSDMAIHPDGDILVVNGFDEGGQGVIGDPDFISDEDALPGTGDILKANPDTGTVSLFIERDVFVNPVDSLGNPVAISGLFNPSIAVSGNGRIILANNDFGGAFVSWLSADGGTHRLIALPADYEADADIDAGSNLNFELRGVDVDDSGVIYFSDQRNMDAVVRLTGVDYELTNVEDWLDY